ncbi:hypothetical protein CerSpe_129450 [Prunus speciosa]
MVYFHSSISVCNSVDQPTPMADSMSLTDPGAKSKQTNHVHRSRKIANSPNSSKIPACHRSRSAAIDVVLFIAVVGAFGYLLFPYVKIISVKTIEIVGIIMYVLREEVSQAPLVYGCMGLSICCAALAAWALLACTSRKCGNPNCKGLRKAAEFDIQLETEECVKNSASVVKDGVKKGLFELPRDHHRELEAELKKMAPPNGRAVLVFRARCGCSVGRLEVPGTKKLKKIKK